MTEKFNAAVTASGVTLISQAVEANTKIQFLSAIGSSTAYSDAQLSGLTDADLTKVSRNQTGHISNITIKDNDTVYFEVVLDGNSVASDYSLNSIMILARTGTTDHLFAVIKANQSQYMNAYDNKSATNLQINIGFKIANTDAVSLTVDSAGTLTAADYAKLQQYTDTKVAGSTVVHTSGDENVGGSKTFSLQVHGKIDNASAADKLTPGRSINGVVFDGTKDITIKAIPSNDADIGHLSKDQTFSGVNTFAQTIAGKITNAERADNATSADKATKLTTARKINGVSFDGTGDITLTATPNDDAQLGKLAANQTFTGSNTFSQDIIGNVRPQNLTEGTNMDTVTKAGSYSAMGVTLSNTPLGTAKVYADVVVLPGQPYTGSNLTQIFVDTNAQVMWVRMMNSAKFWPWMQMVNTATDQTIGGSKTFSQQVHGKIDNATNADKATNADHATKADSATTANDPQALHQSLINLEINPNPDGDFETPFIDFHTVPATATTGVNDYDARIIASGGTAGKYGQGKLDVEANGGFTVNNQTVATQPWATGQFETKTLQDFRENNSVPSWYTSNYPRQVVHAIQKWSTMGIKASDMPGGATPTTPYCTTDTDVAWSDLSAPVTQTAKLLCSNRPCVLIRTSLDASTWSAWELMTTWA